MHLVANHMSRDLLTVSSDDRLGDAAKRMVERAVGAVIVLAEGRLDGILTERDLMRAVAAGYSEDARVADWMTRHPETIDADDTTVIPKRSTARCSDRLRRSTEMARLMATRRAHAPGRSSCETRPHLR